MSADSAAKPDVSRGALSMAFGLALGPAVTVELARFVYALTLPAIRADLGWSYAQAGGMNTANALGYLAGAVVAAPLATRIGGRRAFLGGMTITALALLASALSSQYAILLSLRVVAGATGATSFVVGGGLAARVASESGDKGALALGVYFGGGLGILVSALIVPPLLDAGGGSDWRLGWAVLGVASLAALAVCVPLARRAAEPPARPVGASGHWPAGRLTPTFPGLWPLRFRLHLLHDLRRCLSARRWRSADRGIVVLGGFGRGRSRLGVLVGTAAGEAQGWAGIRRRHGSCRVGRGPAVGPVLLGAGLLGTRFRLRSPLRGIVLGRAHLGHRGGPQGAGAAPLDSGDRSAHGGLRRRAASGTRALRGTLR
jgi:MFS family permease